MIFSLFLGIAAIAVGLKALSQRGLPLTKTRNLQGAAAKTVGLVCLMLGGLMLLDAAVLMLKLLP